MSKLLTHEAWPWQPDLCPADQDLIAYLSALEGQNDGRKALVFHMGPGLHHMVGFESRQNVLAITNSPAEMSAYMEHVIHHPLIADRYQCLFGDVQQLPQMFLPKFDIIALPHLGETWDPRRTEYARDEKSTVRMFQTPLQRGGAFVFYTGSSAWDRISVVVDQLEAEFNANMEAMAIPNMHWRRERFGSLLIWVKP